MAWMAPLGIGLAGQFMGRRNRGVQAENPANAAMAYHQQIPQVQQQYLQPWMEYGQQGRNVPDEQYAYLANMYAGEPDLYARPRVDFNEMPEEYGSMRRNPQEFVNNIMRGYSPSEGYRFKENRMLNEMRNSAAAGGYAGSSFHQEGAGNAVRGMLGEDMQQYLSNILGVQTAGLGGEERRIGRRQAGEQFLLPGRERAQDRRLLGLSNVLGNKADLYRDRERMGFEAANALATGGANNLGSMATLGYQGSVENQRQRMEDLRRRAEEGRNRRDLLGVAMGAGANMFNGGGGGRFPY